MMRRPPTRSLPQRSWFYLGSVWLHALALAAASRQVPPPYPEPPPMVIERRTPAEGAVTPSAARSPTDPTPAPPAPSADDRAIPFRRTDPDRPSETPDDPRAIGERAVDVRRAMSSPVTSPLPGTTQRPTAGRGDDPGAWTDAWLPDAQGDPAAGVPSGRASSGAAGGGGGASGRAAGAGAPGDGGTRRDGGERDAGSGDPATSPPPQGPIDARTAPPAPDGWHPFVTRMWVPQPDADPQAGPGRGSASGRAPVRAPGDAADRGGTRGTEANAAPAPTTALNVVSTSAVRADPRPGTEDPVDALRAALGWGPIDRSKLGPRPAWAVAGGQDGQQGGTPDPVPGLPDAWTSAVDVAESPLGHYIADVEREVGRRWHATDLTVHERAIGLGGTVVLRYRIWPDGRVTNRDVVVSSGTAVIDLLAADAIPTRLPRFPRALGLTEPLWHQIALEYRNPMVVP